MKKQFNKDQDRLTGSQRERLTVRNTATLPLCITRKSLKLLSNKILKALKMPSGFSLAIIFLTDRAIRALNRKYLKTGSPTDVLVFDYGNLTADMAISLDTAKRNAGIYKTSYKEEIILYLIHGVLHLAGYDDTDPQKKEKMFRKQEWLLSKLRQLY